ncbi:Arylsulfatase [Rubripirellula tenax]|uniref:Arylsulfatase n=1 Tax=Rubripirellula tenax TaxID=2528015 RepID=A0A5C6F3Z5_9BACT|nr:arylsulfatase [Rubripirellula tenax]TWU54736.1 Arylsulfatase [Rubripirellula tenax]
MKYYMLILSTLVLFAGNAFAAEKPNVVLIFADDLGYGDVGCYGATKVKTPGIDKLAVEGRRFTDAHSASAVCTPSRYALLTGEYPHRRNLSKPVFLKTGLVIDTKQQTAASVMKDAGYDTACIGKWHLGFGDRAPDWNGELKPGPLECGFDYYYGVPVVNSHPPFVYVENHKVVGLVPDDPFVFGKKAKTREFFEKMGVNQIGGADAAHALYDDEAVGTTLTEKAVDWIKNRGKNPFFLYLATTNIHHPFTPAPRFKGTSKCGPYGDFIHELDWIVAEVMKTLEAQGVADNTLVIFTSDNGGMFNVGGQNAWDAGHRLNGELLGFKFGAWEGGHRVPFIARWPEKIEAGSVSDELISNIDMIATFAALTGMQLKNGHGRDSVNVLSALTGNPSKPLRDHIVLAPSRQSHLAVRKGKWMYIGAQGSGGFTAAKRGAHAFGGPAAITYAGYQNNDIENGKIKKDAPPAQLYDLVADVSQTTNLYNEYPEVVKEMQALLETYKPVRTATPKLAPRPAAKTGPKNVEIPVGNAFPGEKTDFKGFDLYKVKTAKGYLSVVCPKEAAPGKPWMWRSGMFWKAIPKFHDADLKLVEQGYHVVLSAGHVYGHPKGNAGIDAAYDLLTTEYGFSKRCSMASMSRETNALFRWAATHPERVESIYVDNGVLNLRSWPGGAQVPGSSSKFKGHLPSWEGLKKAYGFTSDEEALAAKISPIDLLEPLAKAGVPILTVCGSKDDCCIYEEQDAILEQRYKALGGDITVIIENKGHSHGMNDPTPVIEFIRKNKNRTDKNQ